MTWHAHYDEVTTAGGMVTAAESEAADAGAAALDAGGNAVDAAVASAFVLGVVEPEMSGLGGATMMTIHMDGESFVIDGAIQTPRRATSDEFPLADRTSDPDWAVSFYDWPAVEGAVNVIGPRAVAIPGAVAALMTAHERFGRLPRSEVMRRAIDLASDGFEINWFLAALIASNARGLARDEGCSEVFLRGGLPLRGPDVRRAQRLTQPRLAETLAAIAEDGAPAFYEGAVATSIVEHVRKGGGLLELDDLAEYEPEVVDPSHRSYGRLDLVGVPVSGFPSVMQMLTLFDLARDSGIEDEALAWACASKIAMEDRAVHMSAEPDAGAPWDDLLEDEHNRRRLAEELGRGEDAPRNTGSLSTTGGFTSQHSVIDGEGNAVSVTQTVLNTFGARVLDPATGVLLNDGMAYFDPRPGNRNCIRPSARAFSAMTPVIGMEDGAVVASYGASGGRRIITGVAQITRALAEGSSMQEAVEEPRVYAESDVVLLDDRWPAQTVDTVKGAGYTVAVTEEQPTTVHFARPNGVLVGPGGVRRSGLDPKKPAGVAVTTDRGTR